MLREFFYKDKCIVVDGSLRVRVSKVCVIGFTKINKRLGSLQLLYVGRLSHVDSLDVLATQLTIATGLLSLKRLGIQNRQGQKA